LNSSSNFNNNAAIWRERERERDEFQKVNGVLGLVLGEECEDNYKKRK